MSFLTSDHVNIWGPNKDLHLTKYALKLAENPSDAGVDLYPHRILSTEKIPGWVRYMVGTGVFMHFSKGSFGRIIHRSSSFLKLSGGLVQDGTIDSGYIGELFVVINALSEHQTVVTAGIEKCISKEVALAQVIVSPFVKPYFIEKEVFATPRGKNGFGSTDRIK